MAQELTVVPRSGCEKAHILFAEVRAQASHSYQIIETAAASGRLDMRTARRAPIHIRRKPWAAPFAGLGDSSARCGEESSGIFLSRTIRKHIPPRSFHPGKDVALPIRDIKDDGPEDSHLQEHAAGKNRTDSAWPAQGVPCLRETGILKDVFLERLPARVFRLSYAMWRLVLEMPHSR